MPAKITDKSNHVSQNNSPTYRDAGVDTVLAQKLVSQIKPLAQRTYQPGVIGSLGGFGGLFDLSSLNYKNPVLVAGTDGVGTKIKLAHTPEHYHHIGIDLVAMCVNDVLVQGATPLFFLDYFATSQLNIETITAVVSGISAGCLLAKCSLIGGETAEMPGTYAKDEYDLAGFCVGIVEKDALISGTEVAVGDSLIALSSSGLHANGYSLVRKLLKNKDAKANAPMEALLTPTRIYVPAILALLQKVNIKAIAHITGGGLLENIPRTLPKGLAAHINLSHPALPSVFDWLFASGVSQKECKHAFNYGIGMTLCIAPEDTDTAIKLLKQQGETAWQIGNIHTRQADSPAVVLNL